MTQKKRRKSKRFGEKKTTVETIGKPTWDVSRWRLPYILLLLTIIALSIRVVYIVQLAENPFFEYPIVDSDTYDTMAVKVAAGEESFDGPFFQPPLYPYFLGLLYKMLGRTLGLVRFAQMLLGIVNVLLVYILSRRLVDRRTALGVGLAFALYGTMLFFEGELLTPVLIVFCNVLLMLSLLWTLEKPVWWRGLITGLLLGTSALSMAVILPFVLVALILGWWWYRKREDAIDWKKQVLIGVAFVVGVVAVIAPVTIRNYTVGDDFVLISSNAGINLYIGNSPDYDSTVGIRPGYDWQNLGQEPMHLGYNKPSEQSKYFIGKTLEVVKDDPGGFVGNIGKKLFLFANGNEIMRNQTIYPFRDYSPLLSVLIWKAGIAFPFGLLLPLAIAGGLIAMLRRDKKFTPLLIFIATHIAIIVLFFVSARYRINILPFLLIFAGYGVAQIIELVRRKEWKTVVSAGGVFALSMLLCNWNVGAMSHGFNADAYYNLGVEYTKEERPGAKELYEKAIELDPDYPEANGNLGICLAVEGDSEGAIDCFEMVLKQYPDDIEANINLGNEYFKNGDISGAEEQFEKVLELRPNHPIAIENLKIVRANREVEKMNKRLNEAIAKNPEILTLLKQLQTDPENPALLTNLGAAYLDAEYYDLAIRPLSEAVRLSPGLIQAHNNLGIALAELGDIENARLQFETVLKLEPESKSTKNNLEYLMELEGE